MQYFTEQASSHREAIETVRSKYGEQAQILSHRTVRSGGILGLFAREVVEVSGYLKPRPTAAALPTRPRDPDLEEEKRRILNLAKSPGAAISRPAPAPQGGAAQGSTRAHSASEAVGSDQALDKVLAELRELRTAMGSPRIQAAEEEHESIAKIDELLAENDFSEAYRRDITGRIRRDFTLETLGDFDAVQDRVLEWIGDSIVTWREAGNGKPRILALVGPTGVGKTTTIAKLAAIYTVGIGGEKPRSVRMITIDNYRIGARQQIETYGNIMGVPVSCVETIEDLRKTLDLHSDADLILLDTIGKSPRDAVKLAEVQRLVAACGPKAEVHLALAATTKASDMAAILRQFEPFGYGAVVLTKLDETDRVGNAISTLAERGKALSYLTTGQRVPQDIERAEPLRLLMRLEGFRPDRAALEERYAPAPVAETPRRPRVRLAEGGGEARGGRL
ncbi:MAG TPA: flagellar biosynthesis protein FlhF [Rectinemataceae bacterium]|nr:flagellar biosynthesis protein FlhF [Rectinemataceae bacterium]